MVRSLSGAVHNILDVSLVETHALAKRNSISLSRSKFTRVLVTTFSILLRDTACQNRLGLRPSSLNNYFMGHICTNYLWVYFAPMYLLICPSHINKETQLTI